MKYLKRIIIGIAGLVIFILLAALIVPKEYHLERDITITRSRAETFEYVKYLKNQDNYSVWAKMDPDMIKKYTGTDGEIGFISSWESDNKDVGKGEPEIIDIIEEERVDFKLRFMEPCKEIIGYHDPYLDNAFLIYFKH